MSKMELRDLIKVYLLSFYESTENLLRLFYNTTKYCIKATNHNFHFTAKLNGIRWSYCNCNIIRCYIKAKILNLFLTYYKILRDEIFYYFSLILQLNKKDVRGENTG